MPARFIIVTANWLGEIRICGGSLAGLWIEQAVVYPDRTTFDTRTVRDEDIAERQTKILSFAGPPHERSALSQQIGMRLYPFALIYILDRIEGQGEASLR